MFATRLLVQFSCMFAPISSIPQAEHNRAALGTLRDLEGVVVLRRGRCRVWFSGSDA